MNSEINAFINKYVKEIRNNNAAFFAGAGFSKESGYVDWKTLLESIALELNLELEKEHDLVALAQYYYNKHQNRGMINDVIFEEFKGTGNMEVHLDRKLSEKRIFPAIDINKSGTRREELLLEQKELETVFALRKAMSTMSVADITEELITEIMNTKTNQEFLEKMALFLKNMK